MGGYGVWLGSGFGCPNYCLVFYFKHFKGQLGAGLAASLAVRWQSDAPSDDELVLFADCMGCQIIAAV